MNGTDELSFILQRLKEPDILEDLGVEKKEKKEKKRHVKIIF